MPLNLMYITNKVNIAQIAERCGVDWIFIDLEINGKDERQGHLDTVISRHHIEDVKRIKGVLNKSKLLVRVNPIFNGSINEIDRVINDGADIVMLPYFKFKSDVEEFINIVNGRAKTCLLCETPEAVENIDDILTVGGIDFLHIGLNDLHLGYNMKFMFELLANGTVDKLCNKFKDKDIQYGFGGIARLGQGDLPAEYIIAEHYRLGSNMAILSRSFCNANKIDSYREIEKVFKDGINEIRILENNLKDADNNFFIHNHIVVRDKVMKIESDMVNIESKVRAII